MKKIQKLILLITISFISIFSINNILFADSESTTLKLSNDIGKMADRIGVMSDRILTMADKIVETQKIQSKNFNATQENILKSLNLIEKEIDSNNNLLKALIDSNNKVSNCMCKK